VIIDIDPDLVAPSDEISIVPAIDNCPSTWVSTQGGGDGR
jgi:hypothetical protein